MPEANIVTIQGTPVSIQGEQQQAAASDVWATDDEVAEYVQRVADGVLQCRERGRHLFPPVRVAGMHFIRVTKDGLLVRRVPCGSCEKVDRVELWDVRQRRGVVTRAELVSATLAYTDPDYLAKPGAGRMKPRQIRNAVASLELGGQNYRAVLKAANAAAEERRTRGREQHHGRIDA